MKRPRPLSSQQETSGSTALRQIGLSAGIYVTNNNTARLLGCPDLDLSCKLTPEQEKDLSRKPLELGGSLDFALKRLGIHIESWDTPIQKTYRDQLSDAFMWAHTQLRKGHLVLMLMQGEKISDTTTTTTSIANKISPNVDPLCWVLVDSAIDMRNGAITLSLHNGFDEEVHQRTAASMRLPSLHKVAIRSEDKNLHHVTRVTVPRSVPITLRVVKGYISPFVGNCDGNPLQTVHCSGIVQQSRDMKRQEDTMHQVKATVTLPNSQLNKSHTLYLFDDPQNIPNHLSDYWDCNSVNKWHFTLIFENTWSVTTDVPTTGAAIFKCVETLIDPKILKRKKANALRKKAKEYLSAGGSISDIKSKQSHQNKNNLSNLSSFKNITELKTTRRLVDSRGPGRPRRLPQKLPSLTEVETLPVFMQAKFLDKGLKSPLFINERKLVNRENASIRVYVHIDETEFLINCGTGSQNIKWLALTAGQRYQTSKKGRGFKLPGHIVGTKVSATKIIDKNNPDSHQFLVGDFISTNISVDQWETDISSHSNRRRQKQPQSKHHRNSPKRLIQLTAKIKEKNVTPISQNQKELPRRAFTPEKGADHRAKSNCLAEEKAIGAAEVRFKTLQLLSKSDNKKKVRTAKRKFLKKLKTTIPVSQETKAASKIQAIQRGRLRRRKLNHMNKAAGALQAAFRGKKVRRKLANKKNNGDNIFQAISEKREKKRKQSIIDSVMNKKNKKKDNEKNISTFGIGLGSKPDPFVPIRTLLSDEAHCWIDLQTTITGEGDNPIVTMWMDKAYYKNKFAERGARLNDSRSSIAGKQAAYWASIMAQEKIKDAESLFKEMDRKLNKLTPDLLFNVAQLVRKFSPRLTIFFDRYLMLLKISEDDRVRAKNAAIDLKLALELVGPNSSDPVPSQKRVEEAFILTIKAMKVASDLVPEACHGLSSLDEVGQPDFNVLDLLQDSKKLHTLMHKICSVEWSSMDEGTAFGIAAQVEELKETVLDATNSGERIGTKIRSWAETASRLMSSRFGALNRVVTNMLEEEADERASMTEFEKIWEKTGVETMIQDEENSVYLYKAITSIARHSFSHSKNVFQYYSVIGGGVFDVSFSELMLFLKNSGAYDNQDQMKINDVANAFKMAAKSEAAEDRRAVTEGGGAGENEIDLAGWLVVILKLSSVRYKALFNNQWDRAYEYFIDMHMVPCALEVTGDEGKMRVALRSPEVLSVMDKYESILEDVFIKYSNDEGELEMESYVQLVTDAGLIDADLTRLECRRSFVRSQIAASNELQEQDYNVETVDEDNGQEDRSMNLDEFLHSLPRLGCDKWDEGVDGELPVHIKQERISSALSLLDPLSSKERRKKDRRVRQFE